MQQPNRIAVANSSSTGTTLNKFAKLTGAPSKAVITATTDTGGALGIVVAGAGTSGTATIQLSGILNCVFDGATTAGDYVQLSSTTAGDCHDSGSTYPTSGQVLGRVLTTNGGAGTYQIDLFPAEIKASSGGGFAGVNAQTASYLLISGDNSKLVTMNCSSCTATLPAAPPSSTWSAIIENLNASALTISRNSLTINGGTSNITVQQYQTVSVWTDGTNYLSTVPDVAGTDITLTQGPNGQTIGLTSASTTPNGQTCTLGSTCNVNNGAATHSVAINEGAGAAIGAVALGAHQTLIGASSADPSAKTVPDCTDSAGNHLNFTQSTDAWSCGTSAPAQLHVINFGVDGGGAVIPTGDIGFYPTVAFACTITRIDIAADQSGSVTVDVWKAAGAIPTSSNKISASAPLTLSSAQIAQNGSRSGWSTSVSSGDVFGFSVATATTVTKIMGQVWCQ